MSSVNRHMAAGFYCIGIVMTLGCLAMVLAGNTDLVWPFEHRSFPLSWALGATAILAFLASEFSPAPLSLPDESQEQASELTPELEAAEF